MEVKRQIKVNGVAVLGKQPAPGVDDEDVGEVNRPVMPGDRVLASPHYGAALKWGEVDECRIHISRHKSGELSMFPVYLVRFRSDGKGKPYLRALSGDDIKKVKQWSR